MFGGKIGLPELLILLVIGTPLYILGRFLIRITRSSAAKDTSPFPPLKESTHLSVKKFCVHCGHPYEPSHQFCNSCGRPTISSAELIKTPGGASISGSGAAAVQPQLETPIPEIKAVAALGNPPYAQFALFALTASMFVSVIAFNIADAIARGKWDSSASTAIAAAMSFALFVRTVSVWRKLEPIPPNNQADPSSKKVRSRSIFFGTFFVVIGVIMGTAIGTSGAETNQFLADSEASSQLINRIFAARRSSERTVNGQIRMYKSIDNDVQAWNAALNRVRKDLDIYDQKYPAQHDATLKSIQSIETGIRRADLLRKQVQAAKEIDFIPPADQWQAWQKFMQPLLEQEDALDRGQ